MFLKYNLPGIVWGVFILFVLGIPGDDIPKYPFLKLIYFDKLVHIFLFAVFAVLLILGFIKQRNIYILNRYSVISALTVSVLYGGLTELLQKFVFYQRTADVYDFVFDILGAVSGMFFVLFYNKKIRT